MAHSAARSSLRPSCEGRSQPSSISRWMSAWVGGTPTARSLRRAARSSGRMRPGISRRWTRVGARRATSSGRSADDPSRPPSFSLLGSDSLLSQLQLPAQLPTTTTYRAPNSHSSPAMSNPRVFLDCSINGNDAGRIVVELYKDVSPKTVSSSTRSSRSTTTRAPSLTSSSSSFPTFLPVPPPSAGREFPRPRNRREGLWLQEQQVPPVRPPQLCSRSAAGAAVVGEAMAAAAWVGVTELADGSRIPAALSASS